MEYSLGAEGGMARCGPAWRGPSLVSGRISCTFPREPDLCSELWGTGLPPGVRTAGDVRKSVC